MNYGFQIYQNRLPQGIMNRDILDACVKIRWEIQQDVTLMDILYAAALSIMVAVCWIARICIRRVNERLGFGRIDVVRGNRTSDQFRQWRQDITY